MGGSSIENVPGEAAASGKQATANPTHRDQSGEADEEMPSMVVWTSRSDIALAFGVIRSEG